MVHDDIAPIDDRNRPFGDLQLGNSSEAQLAITNQGMQALNISGISTSTRSSYTVDLTSGSDPCLSVIITPLSPGQSCTFSVTFAPDVAGNHDTVLTIISNDPDEPVVTIDLIGSGIDPDININPNSLDFGSVISGQEASEELVVSNIGSGPLTISGIGLIYEGLEQYSLDPTGGTNPCGNTPIIIPEGGECTISLNFTPQSAGTHTATLVIISNDPDEDTLSISVTGNEIPPNNNSDSNTGGGGGGGGCTVQRNAPFDPLFPGLLLLAGVYLLRQRKMQC